MVNKNKVNPMLNSLKTGQASLARIRLDVPMWSVEHLQPVIDHLKDTMRALKSIKHSNSVPAKYKPTEARSILKTAAVMLKNITSGDLRERGAEDLRYTGNGLIDHNGFEHFNQPIYETNALDYMRDNSAMYKIREGQSDEIKEETTAQQDHKKPGWNNGNRTKSPFRSRTKTY